MDKNKLIHLMRDAHAHVDGVLQHGPSDIACKALKQIFDDAGEFTPDLALLEDKREWLVWYKKAHNYVAHIVSLDILDEESEPRLKAMLDEARELARAWDQAEKAKEAGENPQ